jgi:hypothetical protein
MWLKIQIKFLKCIGNPITIQLLDKIKKGLLDNVGKKVAWLYCESIIHHEILDSW